MKNHITHRYLMRCFLRAKDDTKIMSKSCLKLDIFKIFKVCQHIDNLSNNLEFYSDSTKSMMTKR